MLTIFHTEASLGWGGQEIRILKESAAMRARGHRVVIVAEAGSGLMKRAGDAGFETVALSFRRRGYPGALVRILGLIKRYRPDVINTHSSRDSWLFSLAGRISGLKPLVVRTRHLSTPVAANKFSRLIYARLPHGVITTAEAIREDLIARIGVDPERIASIPTGVELDLFDPDAPHKAIRDEIGVEKDAPLVAMVSVLRSWKGHEYFIEAAPEVAARRPDARFLIVGDGPKRGDIERRIAARGLDGRVLMLGHREDIPDVMAAIDVLVQPSYANEGVPQSLIQALSMGVAVVVSDLKPLMEVVDDGVNGLACRVRDPKDIAAKILALIEDEGLRRRLGQNGRRIAAGRFSMEKMADAVESFYGAALKRKAEGR